MGKLRSKIRKHKRAIASVVAVILALVLLASLATPFIM